MSFSKKIVSLIVVLNVCFTGAVLFLNYGDHSVAGELIVSWFAFTGTELVALTTIKIVKTKKIEKGDE